MLAERKADILKAVVGDYIATATPVGSTTIALRHRLGISPATIRSIMADLEEDGYITHPYTSAGRIPSDRGYRYYVESLMGEASLPEKEIQSIRRQVLQAERDIEGWERVVASLLSQAVRNVSLMTPPKPFVARIKRLELVSLQEFLVLLILVLQEASVKKQTITLDSPLSQDKLTEVVNRLNATYSGLTSDQISTRHEEQSPLEKQVIKASVRLMKAEDEKNFEDLYFDGLRHAVSQPEFSDGLKMRQIIEILEEKKMLKGILARVLSGEGVRLVIGSENEEDALRECSIVFAPYGIPGEISGAVGVLGPTRMEYARTISAVHYLSMLMGEVLEYLRS